MAKPESAEPPGEFTKSVIGALASNRSSSTSEVATFR